MSKFNQMMQEAHIRVQTHQPQAVERAAKIMAQPKMQIGIHAIAALLMLGAMPLASAAGFEAEAKGMAEKIYKGIYAVVGVVAMIVVLWQCVEGWSGRKSWMDVMATSMWIVVAAAAGAFVTWLWSKGSSMSFS